jgi:hypothetical protein
MDCKYFLLGTIMYIADVQSAQAAYQTFSIIHNRQGEAAALITPPAPQQDSADISQEAKDLFDSLTNKQNNEAAKAGPETTGQELPLKAYSLPGWYADLLPEYCMVDTKLGEPYTESNQARYDSLSTGEKRDLAEYNETLHSYFRQELESRGIDSPADYYENMVQNQEMNQEVEQAVKQSLASDPRAMELMSYFNLSL